MASNLSTYHAKRNFSITSEPKGKVTSSSQHLRFCVQKHHASHLHYDFRLELDGTLKSWAVPKGPSVDPAEKRLAVHVEDHPIDYIDFEGVIPEKQYGAGVVEVWDIGTWEPIGDAAAGYASGKLKFHLEGQKLHGGWTLVRTRRQSGGKEQWLLIKERDDHAQAADDFDITSELPDSVLAKTKIKRSSAKSSKTKSEAKTSTSTKATATKSSKAKKSTSPVKEVSDQADLPTLLTPQLATLVSTIPESGEWIYELKFDGYRLLARIDNGKVKLFTRNGNDWSKKLPKQVEAIKKLSVDNAWLDGEIVVLDKKGVPSFHLLQNAFDENSTAEIQYFVFDLLHLNGHDLKSLPLIQRRELLEKLLGEVNDGIVHYSPTLNETPERLLQGACHTAMEGIIGKRADSIYNGKRSADWIKVKCSKRQEFIIAGYIEPEGSRQFFRSLILAVYEDDGTLTYAGRVGTGFDVSTLRSTYHQLKPIEQTNCPFDKWPGDIRRSSVHWVKPQIVAEIEFSEWTDEGALRHPVFRGLRIDKPAKQIRREQAVPLVEQSTLVSKRTSVSTAKTSQTTVNGVNVTHPERVIDKESGFTKLDLIQYYEHVAPTMLPYLKNRPVYLLRAPEGVGGELFFQKHNNQTKIPGITVLDASLDPKHDPYMAIDSPQALVGATQMGAIELHIANATADAIEKPDSMIFDLDPDPTLPWSAMVQAAELTKALLEEFKLVSFLKTSGGKGLHLVVPLSRRHSWDVIDEFSQAVAEHLAATIPTHFSAKSGAKNRVGKIFVDYLRNSRQASTVAIYSARARPGLAVSVPIRWEELKDINSAAMWNIKTLPQRLAKLRKDPWADYFKTKQSITALMMKRIKSNVQK